MFQITTINFQFPGNFFKLISDKVFFQIKRVIFIYNCISIWTTFIKTVDPVVAAFIAGVHTYTRDKAWRVLCHAVLITVSLHQFYGACAQAQNRNHQKYLKGFQHYSSSLFSLQIQMTTALLWGSDSIQTLYQKTFFAAFIYTLNNSF